MAKFVFGDSIVLPKASGTGIMRDHTSPAFGWKDLIGPIFPKTSGAGSPARTLYRGNMYEWAVVANDQVDVSYHIPHDFAGGDLYMHAHQSHNGTNISGSAVWTCYCTYAKGHNQANFPAEVAPTITYATVDLATTPQYRHRIDEIQLSASSPSATQLDSDDIEPDGLIMVTCKLTTAPTVTGGSWFIHFFDIHYQGFGGDTTKQRAPNFYT